MEMQRRALFPTDIALHEVRSAIAGRPEFVERDCGDHVVFTYNLGQAVDGDMFPDPRSAPSEEEARAFALRRECRGLVFSKGGVLLARRFHKFFNIGEKEECTVDRIDWDRPFVVLEKLDGSMVSPYRTGGSLRWGTRAGLTDTGAAAEAYARDVAKHGIPYDRFCEEWLARDWCCLWEYCSPQHRIVLRYEEDSLRLLAMRRRSTGEYMPYDEMRRVAGEAGIPAVASCELSLKKSEELISAIRERTNVEGFVIRFETGEMYKLKTHWYFKHNKSIDHFRSKAERYRWATLLNGDFDDVKPLLEPQAVIALERFFAKMLSALQRKAEQLRAEWEEWRAAKLTREQFGEQVVKTSRMPAGVLWKLFAKDDVEVGEVRELLLGVAKKSLGSKRRFDVIKDEVFDGLSMNDYYKPANR